MPEMKYRTRGNATPSGKPRVYFTCHPDDFDKYFDKLCEDIFQTHDCAIYYTSDMTEPFAEEDKETDLGSLNLFVVPVTFRLLTEPNRAMDADIAYAKEKHIPLLPFMMEPGLDPIYARPDKFGERQYLNPFSHDLTEIGYAEKLKKYLESVLISDELAQRIRQAFDGYLFLSYRKKDRRHANELMKLIHNDPDFRDVAIWYDEFLTPGDDFREDIRRALHKSSLFLLLVTPNLLEMPDGRPNFVMGEEYPMARRMEKAGKFKILPVEMVKTNHWKLRRHYPKLRGFVCPDAEGSVELAISRRIPGVVEKNSDSPEHYYLIGMAYLGGVDVELDRARGVKLVTAAANNGCMEAAWKLYRMYSEGEEVAVDYQAAFHWLSQFKDHCVFQFGEKARITLTALNNLALLHGELGNFKEQLQLNEAITAARRREFGASDPDTVASLINLAHAYIQNTNYQRALEVLQEAYAVDFEKFGREHPEILLILHYFAFIYHELGDYRKAMELYKEVYDARCRVLGSEHPDSLTTLSNLGVEYSCIGDHKTALQCATEAYNSLCKVLGREHPDSLNPLGGMALAYSYLGEHEKALPLYEEIYRTRCRIFGEEHPDALNALNNIVAAHSELGDDSRALELGEKVYVARCKTLGEEHPGTLTSLKWLASISFNLGDHTKALELYERLCTSRRRVLGDEHPDTLTALNDYGVLYSRLGEHAKALTLHQEVYAAHCRGLGCEHPKALTSLANLAGAYGELGEHSKAIELYCEVYTLRCKTLGEAHPSTLSALRNRAILHKRLGENDTALTLYQTLYDTHCKAQGERHPEALRALNDLADLYYDREDYAKALELHERGYVLSCELNGSEHPTTRNIRQRITDIRTKCGLD